MADQESHQAPLPVQQPETPGVADTPETERAFVQNVYDNIADHFSRTRYAVCQAVHSNKSKCQCTSSTTTQRQEQAWPGPESFLRALAPHSVVADIGCGNGKYMVLQEQLGVRMVGCDVCQKLVRIAAERGLECFACDGLHTPFRDASVVCYSTRHQHQHPLEATQPKDESAMPYRTLSSRSQSCTTFAQRNAVCKPCK